MAKRTRPHRRRPFAPHPSSPSSPAPGSPSTTIPQLARAGRRRWFFRLALSLFVPAVLLVGVEAALRLFGVGFPADFLLRVEDGNAYVINEDFLRPFYPRQYSGKSHPFRLPSTKGAGTIRIFILGESAALGTPNPSFGFGRILEVLLQSQYPDRRFEVFNAAMRGINSHIILPVARDCARHQPDLFLVYMGNNEAVGLYAPGPDSSPIHRSLRLIRLVQAIRSTRLGQGIAALTAGAPAAEQDMAFFRSHRIAMDDPRRETVYAHFQSNVDELCDILRRSGAGVILSTLAVNLKDFPPLGSLHRRDLDERAQKDWESLYAQGTYAEAQGRHEDALQHYRAAAKLDDRYADLHFRIGRCLDALGRAEEARRHFGLARDWDALPFRADARVNQILREAAASHEHHGVRLVDGERALAESASSERGIPGDRLFHEHVHLRFEGDYLLARALYPAVVSALGEKLGKAGGAPLPSRDDCADRLAYTAWDELQTGIAMTRLRSNPPFLDQIDHAQSQARAERAINERAAAFTKQDVQRAIDVYKKALNQRPDDWQLHHNFGVLCYLGRDFATAARHLEVEVELFPHRVAGRLLLGAALAKAGKAREAIAQFDEALRVEPRNLLARKAIDELAGSGRGEVSTDGIERLAGSPAINPR